MSVNPIVNLVRLMKGHFIKSLSFLPEFLPTENGTSKLLTSTKKAPYASF